jgi:RimJ/RimL family protein N-acetyltransferase
MIVKTIWADRDARGAAVLRGPDAGLADIIPRHRSRHGCGAFRRVSHRHASMKHVDLTTTPLTLHPFTVADAERVLSGEVDPHDGWEGGYAFTDEPELLSEYVRAVRETGDPAPFGPYLVRRERDGLAIGGVNLFGPPDADGAVEFAFGLVPAVRGQGLAVDTVLEVLELARSTGAAAVRAEAEICNLPARRALERAGLVEAERTGDAITYQARL